MTERGVRGGVVWSVLTAELAGGTGQRVLDLGGGSGVLAVPLAEQGCEVTVVDTSADALATLHRRAEEAAVAERVHSVQGDVDALPELSGGFDLALCHSVLEFVDDPAAAVGALAATLRPGGALSLLVANRAAAVLARAVGGHLAQAHLALTDPEGRWDGAERRRRFGVEQVRGLLDGAGLAVESVHGIRVFADLVPGALLDREPGAAEELRRLEAAASTRSPYRDIASQLHLLARL